MKQKIILLILILCAYQFQHSFGQSTEYDTVFIKRTVLTEKTEIDTILVPGGISPAQPQILVGTTFLPYTEKMIGLLNHGLSPISLELVEGCTNSSDPSTFKDFPKFISTSRIGDTLTIDVSVVANCCHHFLGEAEVLGGDTLNLVYTSYGGFCSCDCCFTLRYRFNTQMEAYYQTLKYVTINGSKIVGEIRP